jgi:hypothetical protein
MKLSRVSRRFLLTAAGLAGWLALGGSATLVPPVLAEVGVVDSGDAQAVIPYIAASVTDEGDPLTLVWQRHSTSPTRNVLNEGGFDNGDGPPSLVVLPSSGEPVAAWSRSTAAGFDIVVSRYTEGSWTEPVAISEQSADELDPVLVTNPETGDVHVVYWVRDTVPRIEHRQAPADLSTWSAPRVLSQAGIAAARPSATWHGGTLHVVYEAHVFGLGQVPRQIVLTRPFQDAATAVVATTWHAAPNRPRVHGDGIDLWVEWIESSGAMGWTRETATETWGEVRAESYDGVLDRDYHAPGRIRAIVRQR